MHLESVTNSAKDDRPASDAINANFMDLTMKDYHVDPENTGILQECMRVYLVLQPNASD